jgi:hypothetical protein
LPWSFFRSFNPFCNNCSLLLTDFIDWTYILSCWTAVLLHWDFISVNYWVDKNVVQRFEALSLTYAANFLAWVSFRLQIRRLKSTVAFCLYLTNIVQLWTN